MISQIGQKGRKGLMAIAVAALFMLNLNGALAAGDDSIWLGDRVWHDYDGKGDQENILDMTEPGFNDVKVHLYRDNGDGVFDRNTDTDLGSDITESGTSPDGYTDGTYGFEIEPSEYDYWVWIDESTLPSNSCGWFLTTDTKGNPQKVTYTGNDKLSIDFGYEPLACPADAEPTAVTLSSFMASSASQGASRWPWLAVLATLAAGGTLCIRQRWEQDRPRGK